MVEPSNNGPQNSGKLKDNSFFPWFSIFIPKNGINNILQQQVFRFVLFKSVIARFFCNLTDIFLSLNKPAKQRDSTLNHPEFAKLTFAWVMRASTKFKFQYCMS